jgi:hypothetical protein
VWRWNNVCFSSNCNFILLTTPWRWPNTAETCRSKNKPVIYSHLSIPMALHRQLSIALLSTIDSRSTHCCTHFKIFHCVHSCTWNTVLIFQLNAHLYFDTRSTVGIATCFGLDGSGIESRWGEIFHVCSYRPWGPPSLLHNWYRVSFPGVKRPGRGVDHSHTPSAEVKERVGL